MAEATTAPVAAFEQAREVADAVLYEGYVLYPYRASAPKNQLRWQFGVLVPAGFSAEPSTQRTECVVELPAAGVDAAHAELHLVLRFLQLQDRTVGLADPDAPGGRRDVPALRSGGVEIQPFEEGVEHQVSATVPLRRLVEGEVRVPVTVPDGDETERVVLDDGAEGVIVRRRWSIDGVVRVRLDPLADAARPAARLQVLVENSSEWTDPTAPRADALRRSLLGTHLLLGVGAGRFVSMLEPPVWAEAAVEACRNRHTFPVLVGEPGSGEAVLSSPVIMYDHPQVAPESQGDFFDATEIDELLTLRTLTLTDDEKREARATDPRTAAIVDRVESMTPEQLSALHGTFRGEEQLPRRSARPDPVSGLEPGTRVRLAPRRRADAQDLFLVGRHAVVHDTIIDVDGTVFVTVQVEDDPAAELHEWYGRFLFFTPDELEPLEAMS